MYKESQNFNDEQDGHEIQCKDLIILNRNEKKKEDKLTCYEISVACSNCDFGTIDITLKVFIPLKTSVGEFLGLANLQCPNCKCVDCFKKL